MIGIEDDGIPCTKPVNGVTVTNSTVILNETATRAIDAVSGSLYYFTVTRDDGVSPETVLAIRRCPRGRGARLEGIGESRTPLFPYAQTAVVTLQFCPGAVS
jgi:hypothetical protein